MTCKFQSRSGLLAGIGLGSGGVILAAGVFAAAGGFASPPPPPESPTPRPAAAQPPAVPPAPPPDAYVELFDDTELDGRKLTLRPGNDIRSLDGVPSDNGMDGFEDKPASVRWSIPVGWQLVLFEHKNFGGHRLELKGTGRPEETHDLGCFTDTASSARWEYVP